MIAGLSFAVTAAQRGHNITIYEKDISIGGQFNIAKLVPGKEEFNETLRYYNNQIKLLNNNIILKLKTEFNENNFVNTKYDSIVIATGVLPRNVAIPNKSKKVKVSFFY